MWREDYSFYSLLVNWHSSMKICPQFSINIPEFLSALLFFIVILCSDTEDIDYNSPTIIIKYDYILAFSLINGKFLTCIF